MTRNQKRFSKKRWLRVVRKFRFREEILAEQRLEYTERSLIEREVNKKTRHIPIRQLMNRVGSAVFAIKPCYMMSLMSVVQYLKPGQVEFDVLIMDEASQIKPQDVFGAIARANKW